MVDRVDHLARALSKEFGWEPNKGTEWDKVIGIFALNTVCANARGEKILKDTCADTLLRSIR